VKLSEIQIGGRYRAKVSGRLVVVRVSKIEQASAFSVTSGNHFRTRIEVVNEATGRRINFRSPQRLRRQVEDGCEFCRQEFNRPAGAFTCPYCGKKWPAKEAPQ
jgi:hypothetical protein